MILKRPLGKHVGVVCPASSLLCILRGSANQNGALSDRVGDGESTLITRGKSEFFADVFSSPCKVNVKSNKLSYFSISRPILQSVPLMPVFLVTRRIPNTRIPYYFYGSPRSVWTKREKSQTPKVLTAILTLPNLT